MNTEGALDNYQEMEDDFRSMAKEAARKGDFHAARSLIELGLSFSECTQLARQCAKEENLDVSYFLNGLDVIEKTRRTYFNIV